MATSLLTLTHDEGATDMSARLLGQNTSSKFQVIAQLAQYVSGLAGGLRKAGIKASVNSVAATGTITGVSIVATNSVTIAGQALTAVASGATSVQFNVGADDTATAVSLAAAINANTTTNLYVSATSALGVVTLTALRPGALGNLVTLTKSGAPITVSAATLTGGTNGTETTYAYGGA